MFQTTDFIWNIFNIFACIVFTRKDSYFILVYLDSLNAITKRGNGTSQLPSNIMEFIEMHFDSKQTQQSNQPSSLLYCKFSSPPLGAITPPPFQPQIQYKSVI